MSNSEKKGHRQRLRDRFMRGEANSRSEEALLELLLTYAIPQKDVQPLAARLLSEYGSLSSLLETPIETLVQTDGVKDNTAVLLGLVDWIRQHHPPIRKPKETGKIPIQTNLFEDKSPEPTEIIRPREDTASEKKPIARRRTGLFGNAVLKEAIDLLPFLPETESLDETRSFLRANLHFSAEQTRQRFSNYITRRMFPKGYADAPLRLFAKTFPDTQELREVCFYRFLLAEPLEVEIIEDLIIPNLGTGRLSRERIREYLSEKFPNSKNIVNSGKAVVGALSAGGISKVDRTKISFAYRDIPVASFAFILHSEFPEPGIYDIRKLEENRLIRAMLWKPDRLLHTLYEIRNQGLISKISEIDNVRQFTTRHTLAGVVEQIVSKGKTS